MLKAIMKIKMLDVYGDYAPPAGAMAELVIRNLIYGWNYSGKSTLSRFSPSRARRQRFGDCRLQLFMRLRHWPGDRRNAKTCGHVVRVFNRDFVHAHLNFTGSPSRPTSPFGAKSEDTPKEIARLTEM